MRFFNLAINYFIYKKLNQNNKLFKGLNYYLLYYMQGLIYHFLLFLSKYFNMFNNHNVYKNRKTLNFQKIFLIILILKYYQNTAFFFIIYKIYYS